MFFSSFKVSLTLRITVHLLLSFLVWENLGIRSRDSVVQFLLYNPEMRSSEAKCPNLDNFLALKQNNFDTE